VTDGIRAVAFLMEDAHIQHITNTIAARVRSHLTDHIESLTMNTEDMHNAVEHITSATGKIEEFNNEFQAMMEQLVQATQELTEKTTETTRGNMGVPKVTPVTYAAAVQQQTHLECMVIIAKGHTTAKQMLTQKDHNTTENTLKNLTEKDLVTKANTALDLMGWEGLNKPQHTSFIGTKKLRNRSILYQMDSENTNVQKSFMENSGACQTSGTNYIMS